MEARALITGAAGILGDALLRSPSFPDAVGLAHRTPAARGTEHADLRDPDAAARVLAAVRPAVVIHTVALTDVDACEAAPAEAYATGALTTLNLAEWIGRERPDTLLVYVSSDQVYAGPGPHDESRVRPANAYGAAKHAGELAAARAPRHLTLRTNFVGRSRGARPSYTDWIVATVVRGGEIHVAPDACFSPLHVGDLVDLLSEAVDGGLEGTFNLGSRDGMRKLDFARAVAELTRPGGADAVGEALESAPRRAVREPDLRLDVTKLEQALAHPLPTMQRCLEAVAAEALEDVPDVA